MNDIKIGRVVPFGGYNWRILDIKNNAVLIITEDIVELRAYHNVKIRHGLIARYGSVPIFRR